MNKKQLIIILLAFLLTGCATTSYQHNPIYLSTNESTTGIVVKFSRNLGQTGVIGHLISINDGENIRVEAVSELPIYLNAGVHKIRIISVSQLSKSVWYSVHPTQDKLFYFGKAVEENIDLRNGEIKVIKFTAPFVGTVRGKLEVIN